MSHAVYDRLADYGVALIQPLDISARKAGFGSQAVSFRLQ